jgi:hypothetical protein
LTLTATLVKVVAIIGEAVSSRSLGAPIYSQDCHERRDFDRGVSDVAESAA